MRFTYFLPCFYIYIYIAKGNDIANQIKQAGGKAIVVSGDVTDVTFPERLIEETIK